MGGCHSTKIDPTLRLSNDDRSKQSVTSNKSEDKYKKSKIKGQNQRNWSKLPSLPLEKVYSYLSRNDQFNMSLVCRNWSKGFDSPSVWRTFKLDLKDPQLSNDAYPYVMKLVQKHSCMFRHVDIKGTFVKKKHLMKNICRNFVEFLQILSRSTQLISVNFRCFSYCFRLIDSQTYDEICQQIIHFVASQRRLKRAEFDRCAFRCQEGAKILRELTDHNRETLTHLVIRYFVQTEPTIEDQKPEINPILPTLADLPRLAVLECNYSSIFEHMVGLRANGLQIKGQKLSLTKIILHYYQSYEVGYFRSVASRDWQFLQQQCPDLQVEFTFRGYSPSRRELEFFIVPNMPISRLKFTDESSEPVVKISGLIDHLLACKINDHLVNLHLEWGETIQHLSFTFIPFLHACKKLECLELYINSPSNDMDHFLNSLLENKHEALEKVIIDISNIDDEDGYPSLLNVIDEYVSLLKLVGLDIKVDFHI